MGILISQYKDLYKPTSIMESRRVFFVAHVSSHCFLLHLVVSLVLMWFGLTFVCTQNLGDVQPPNRQGSEFHLTSKKRKDTTIIFSPRVKTIWGRFPLVECIEFTRVCADSELDHQVRKSYEFQHMILTKTLKNHSHGKKSALKNSEHEYMNNK